MIPSILFENKNASLWGLHIFAERLGLSRSSNARPDDLINELRDFVLSDGFSEKLPQLGTKSHFPRLSAFPIPEELIQDWRAQQIIEPSLYPRSAVLENPEIIHNPTITREALAFSIIKYVLGDRPDVVLAAPFFWTGGGEKMICLYLNTLASCFSGASICFYRSLWPLQFGRSWG